MEFLIDEKKKKKAVQFTIEEYEAIQKEIDHYRNTIEELQDELDSIEAVKIKQESSGTKEFNLNEYVSDRNRAISSKNLKKTPRLRPGKNRKVYS
jgi:hypothetical protein